MTTRAWFVNGIEGRHVLLALIAFFGIMFLANGIFVYFAVATFSGGDTSKPYQRGLDYNRTIEADQLQANLGWRSALSYEAKTGRLIITFQDKASAPVTGLHVGARLSRPATDKDDRRVRFKEVSPGIYAADADLPPGLWVISIASTEGGEGRQTAYRLKRRLLVTERP
jgi:nitrogen fixation protein FixH